MLDGRSARSLSGRIESPLKREVLCSVFALSRGAVCSCRCSRCAVRAVRAVRAVCGGRACTTPRSEFRLRSLPRSEFRLRSTPRSEFRLRFLPEKNPSPGVFFTIHTPSRQSWRGHRIARKTPSPGQRRRCVSDAVLAGATDIVFFHHSHAQPSILAWAQDCPTQSWRAHRVSVHRDALPDSPPGFPASNLASNAKEMGKIKLFPRQSIAVSSSDPVVPLVPCTGIFLGPSKSGKTVALISLILEQYRGVFERIYIFSPSVSIDDGWIPVKKYIEEDLGVNTEREQTYWDAPLAAGRSAPQ